MHYDKDNLEEYNARLDMKQPIITVLDRLTEKVQNDNKIQNVQIGLFRLEIADFSEKVFPRCRYYFQRDGINGKTISCIQSI